MSPFWRHCRRRLEIKVVALPDHFLVPILDQESNYLVWLGKWRREKFVTDWAKPPQIFPNYHQLCTTRCGSKKNEILKKESKMTKWVVSKIVVSLNFRFPLAFTKKWKFFRDSSNSRKVISFFTLVLPYCDDQKTLMFFWKEADVKCSVVETKSWPLYFIVACTINVNIFRSLLSKL